MIGTQRLQLVAATMIRPAKLKMHVGEPITVAHAGEQQTGRMRKEPWRGHGHDRGALGQPRKDVYNVSAVRGRDPGVADPASYRPARQDIPHQPGVYPLTSTAA
ncbi:hypothetical protein QJS66_02810 [Kocuria rhizophila]|nr:hypothetical protein QJS66_02810 [Kocuria rhizophila]